MTSRVRARRTKPKPNQPDGWETPAPQSFEDVLYRILRESFGRSDAAARAVARLEYQLALQQIADQPVESVEERVEDAISDLGKPSPATSPAAAAPAAAAMVRGSGQVFDDREFVETFERLSFLRLVLDLLNVLDLQALQPELIQALIDDRFRARTVPGRAAPETSTVAGSDMAVLLHNLQRAAERRARTESRTTKTPKVRTSVK